MGIFSFCLTFSWVYATTLLSRPTQPHIVPICQSLLGWSESKAVMDRNSSKKMKDSVVDGISLTDNNNIKPKDSWDYSKTYHGGSLLGGFSWPPRSYTCSFCKREFRSAQALGGHMNVHRRDRARLRQSPPWVSPSSNPNPNSNPNFPPFTYTFPCILNSSPACFSPPSWASSSEEKSPRMPGSPFRPLNSKDGDSLKTIKALKGSMQEDKCKKGEMVMLDLEIGLRRDLNEDLDLELRLGYN